MTFPQNTEDFRCWATSIGCPPDALPSEDALKSILKSRSQTVIYNLQKRVQPRQHVQAVRNNILVNKVKGLKDKVIPSCERSFLPKEMQAYLKMRNLIKKKENALACLEESKSEFDTLAAAIKIKNIQHINAEHRKDLLESKYNILQFKSESLTEAIKREEENKAKILATMPVKLNPKNANEQMAMNAVQQALKELSSFYNFCNSHHNESQTLEDAKMQLWQKMRTIFANVPNFLLFNTILKLKEEQLQHIMKLNKPNTCESNSHSIGSMANKEPLNNFEIGLLKTKGDLLGLVARYVNARNEVTQVEEHFSRVYGAFVDGLQNKVNNFNAVTDEKATEEIISDFIVQYNMRIFQITRNEFLTQQIEQYRKEIEMNAKLLENHKVLLSSVKQVYNDINTSINRIQYEMSQLTQIKEKIQYSKNVMRNMLNDMQTANLKQNFRGGKLMSNNLSASIMGIDSFELANESVFCSTKLDFDGNLSMAVNNTTLRRSISTNNIGLIGNGCGGVDATIYHNASGMPILPAHLLELNTFAEIPLERLSCVTRLNNFYIAPNPLIIEAHELASTIQLAPGLLLTPFGALQEVHQRVLWASTIAKHANELKLNLDSINVNINEYKSKTKAQHAKINQLLDSIDFTSTNTKHQMQKVERIYKFILDNPMRHFIPSTKTFNNLTYADYESEFLMYYRMATVGGSIK